MLSKGWMYTCGCAHHARKRVLLIYALYADERERESHLILIFLASPVQLPPLLLLLLLAVMALERQRRGVGGGLRSHPYFRDNLCFVNFISFRGLESPLREREWERERLFIDYCRGAFMLWKSNFIWGYCHRWSVDCFYCSICGCKWFLRCVVLKILYIIGVNHFGICDFWWIEYDNNSMLIKDFIELSPKKQTSISMIFQARLEPKDFLFNH